ncbi:sulfatase-like protein [Phytophthora infestans T30-4]|uniref:Sulfatase-like protein n=1 Tax=Phytophthora infestans (strain T30-4) TaxID=403677 RepID=D0P059_PHYIT|nr:sulfatase-like protein [Phytophthora infestans T30-4]EEY70229.1 sulfatase-like protein [Phytophthora infestans T30-4]|eukprot:XP_002996988.1 sulfatase-like protein [Phytophthora infestans T30-4]
MVLVVYRDMRFSFSLLATLIREREHLKDAPISSDEVQATYVTAGYLAVIAAMFALVRVWAKWANLALWNPTQLILNPVTNLTIGKSFKEGAAGVKYESLSLEDGDKASNIGIKASTTRFQLVRVAVVILSLVVLPAIAVVARSACSPLVAYTALNVTLNELLLHMFEPAPMEVKLANLIGDGPWVEKFIDKAEDHERFGDDTLYRRTTGFKGELAFNVTIDNDNPPNVLIIGVESFRYRDSRYLVGEEDPSNLFKGTNLTITPNFDRWAKRGVAMRNIWSSIPTSRSLESLLFAQVPYHSNTQSGITGGRNETKLSGLPQLFSQKGYETFFTTGSSIKLDAWNVFLPTHGYDNVWNDKVMKWMAEEKFNISRDDWRGSEHRGLGWGVHDDVSFRLVGDLLLNKLKQQRKRMARGEPKKPMFVTHYTISSHEPYKSWPKWYQKSAKPDFSAMYEGEEHADRIERYMKVRYFTDMELGKFMDRMQKGGFLNDTIVVIVGDHGQAPEIDNYHLHEESVTRVPAAIIAEGRLGDAVGLVIDDAAEQYDILNTLADITGLPTGGFQQNGIGRSLKRKIPFGKRVVFSNDPLRRMAVIRGHERLSYDAVTQSMMLHDTEKDFHMTTDLLPSLKPEERKEWEALREDGRLITAYYKKRWDENCLLAVTCNNTSYV